MLGERDASKSWIAPPTSRWASFNAARTSSASGRCGTRSKTVATHRDAATAWFTYKKRRARASCGAGSLGNLSFAREYMRLAPGTLPASKCACPRPIRAWSTVLRGGRSESADSKAFIARSEWPC
eukprot:scaffold81389_cov30-Tisochrysis_lutea.AAC.2